MLENNTSQLLTTVFKQPAVDLIARIDKEDVSQLLLIGGSNEDSTLLQNRWKEARIVTVNLQELNGDYASLGQFDLVFSNASIHYYPNHIQLITALFRLLTKNGVLAVQTPNAANMPIQVMLESIARDKKWAHFFTEIAANYFVPNYYYEILSQLTSELLLWETNYISVFFHYQELVHLYAQTEMKPYLSALPTDELRENFVSLLVDLLPAEYKKQTNGALLFPYRRTFFIAKNTTL